MKIGVECHAGSPLLARKHDDPQVIRAAQSDIADRNNVLACGGEQLRSGTGKPLIQKEGVKPSRTE